MKTKTILAAAFVVALAPLEPAANEKGFLPA